MSLKLGRFFSHKINQACLTLVHRGEQEEDPVTPPRTCSHTLPALCTVGKTLSHDELAEHPHIHVRRHMRVQTQEAEMLLHARARPCMCNCRWAMLPSPCPLLS